MLIDKRLNYCHELRKDMREKKENAPEGRNFEMLTLIGMEWNVNETCLG
jgi:hypothetical protein